MWTMILFLYQATMEQHLFMKNAYYKQVWQLIGSDNDYQDRLDGLQLG